MNFVLFAPKQPASRDTCAATDSEGPNRPLTSGVQLGPLCDPELSGGPLACTPRPAGDVRDPHIYSTPKKPSFLAYDILPKAFQNTSAGDRCHLLELIGLGLATFLVAIESPLPA